MGAALLEGCPKYYLMIDSTYLAIAHRIPRLQVRNGKAERRNPTSFPNQRGIKAYLVLEKYQSPCIDNLAWI